jgi:hypothetical protein
MQDEDDLRKRWRANREKDALALALALSLGFRGLHALRHELENPAN